MPEYFELSSNRAFNLMPPAAAAEHTRGELSSLRAVWDGLTDGTLAIASSITNTDHCLLVVRRVPAPLPPQTAARAKAAAILKEVLCGKLQKVVAIELGVSRSTVAVMLKNAICAMGINGPISRVPISLALLAHAVTRPELALAELNRDPLAPQRSCVMRLKRTHVLLESELSEAEFDVASQLLEGKTHSELAARRGRSRRTIANQLAAIFRKLGAQGRFGLLRVAVERARAQRSGARGNRPGLALLAPTVEGL